MRKKEKIHVSSKSDQTREREKGSVDESEIKCVFQEERKIKCV